MHVARIINSFSLTTSQLLFQVISFVTSSFSSPTQPQQLCRVASPVKWMTDISVLFWLSHALINFIVGLCIIIIIIMLFYNVICGKVD